MIHMHLYPAIGDAVEFDVTGRDQDYEQGTVVGFDDVGYVVRVERTGEIIGNVTRFRYRGVERVVL